MRKNPLGKSGILVTPVGMGVLTVGRTQLNLSIDEGADVVRYALERGINFLDTAEYYETYPYIRQALKGGKFAPVIASKSLSPSREGMRDAIEDARVAMDLDVIDIFLLHEVRGGDDFESRAGAWECLEDYKAKGLVKAIGISTHHVDVADMNAGLTESDILFSLINKDSLGIRKGQKSGTKEDMALAILKNHQAGKGFFAMKALGGGNLTGSYLESMDYVTSLPGIDSVMVGLGSMEEVDRLAEYAEGSIDRGYAPDIRDKKIYIDQGDCEGCGLCLERCPNKAIFKNISGLSEVNHSICLTCGYCAPICPVRAIILL